MLSHNCLKSSLTLFSIALSLTGLALYCRSPVLSRSTTTVAESSDPDSSKHEQTSGQYDLAAKEIRTGSAKDSARIAAEKMAREGEQLLKEWKAESSRLGIDKLKSSLTFWRAAGDRQGEARTLLLIGDAYQPLGEYLTALASYNQALSLIRKMRDRRNEGEALNSIGYIYIILGDGQKALQLCTRALSLSRTHGNRRGEAQALHNIGEVQYGRGELQQSLDYYRQALPLWQKLEDREGQALTLLSFGYTYSDQGKVREAFDTYNQALALWEITNHRRGQALTLNATGRLYSRIGESQSALDLFERAMKLIHLVGDPIEEARTLNGIAFINYRLGASGRALEYYNRSLPLYKFAQYPMGEATTLGEIGRVYYSLGDNLKAIDYHQQALRVFKALSNRRLEGMELKELGKCYDSQGDRTKALENFDRARAAYRVEKDLRGEAETLSLIGRIYEEQGRKQEAFTSYALALPLSVTSKYRIMEAASLYNIAHVARSRGDLTQARVRMDEALAVLESLREKVGSQNLRSSYFASVREHYEFYIDVLMSLHHQHPTDGYDTAAFEASERARARSLLETLAAARVGVRKKADPALLDRESLLRKELNDRAERRMRVQPGNDQAEASSLNKQIGDLTSQLSEVEAQIRAGSMDQMASLQMRPLGLQAIQERIVDDQTLLLEYSLGEERSYLWAVSKSAVQTYELPKRSEIEDAARSVYRLLTASQPVEGETLEQRQERVVKANNRLPSEIANLSRLLLGPVTSKLENKRLLIVPDGALQYIPFQILTKSTEPDATGLEVMGNVAEPRPLVADHEIVNEPSASAVALLITEATTRRAASKSVAVLADPVFEVDDPRISSAVAPTATSMPTNAEETELAHAFRDVDLTGSGGHIPRLPASREEADAIMSLAPWRSGFKAVGFEASRATAMGSNLGDYRFVHFATHGFLNDEHPELSGVVLSLFDENGRPQEGFLRLHDIYNLELPVDLVVLSACNTGLGKDVKGEGFVGLTRGFMYAGAASVVASLWKVDDEATAELMRYFYGFMLKDGLAPAAALRKAQVTMSLQKRWHSPYYWSGFIIQGRYTQDMRADRFGRGWAVWVCLVAVVGIVAVFALRRRRIRIH